MADIKTALLAGTVEAGVRSTKGDITTKYDTYESKHGHEDTEEEQHKVDDVLHVSDGTTDRKLRYYALFLDKLSKIIISVFSFLVLATAAAMVFAILGLFFNELVWLIIILSITCIGASLGAYGTYKYGAFEQYYNAFEETNQHYEAEVESLSERKDHLKKNVRGVSLSVKCLEKGEEQLEQTLKEYDVVLKDLMLLVGKSGGFQQAMDMINGLLDLQETTMKLMIRSKKAALLAQYYSVQAKDGEAGLNKREYERFLCRLSKAQRLLFQQKGTYEEIAGSDGIICINDFQDVVDSIIAQCDEDMLKHIKSDIRKQVLQSSK